MAGQDHLVKLVDLALCNPEVGAVNFNHLRTLLLAIITKSSSEKGDVDGNVEDSGLNEGTDPVEKTNSSDSGINITSNQNDGIADKLESVLSSHKSLEDRLNSLEKDLDSYAKFKSNDEILNNFKESDESGSEASDKGRKSRLSSVEQLAPTWQNMKVKKRLETAEEGIDKLFSLMNDVLAQGNQGENSQAQGDNEGFDRIKKDLADLANCCDVEHQKLKDQNEKLDQKQTEMFDKLKKIEEDIEKTKAKIQENEGNIQSNKNGVDENKKEIDDVRLESQKGVEKNLKDISDLKNQLDSLVQNNTLSSNDENLVGKKEELPLSTGSEQTDMATQGQFEALSKKVKENSKRIEHNQKQVEENVKKIDENSKKLQGISDQMEKNVNRIGENANRAEENSSKIEKCSKDSEENSKDIKEIRKALDSKADSSKFNELSDKVVALEKKVDDSVADLQEQINKLKESMSNLDNAEVKDLLDQIDELKKMAEQIEELRKLSDLKDLADNVDSLKDLKAELDRLKGIMEENENNEKNQEEELGKKLEDFMRKQLGLEEDINGLKEKTSKQEELQDSNKQFEELLFSNKDFEKKMNLLNEELGNLKNSYQNLLSMLSDLQNKQNNSTDKQESPGLDASLLAAIQHLVQQNRQQIAGLQAELNLLKKLQVPSTQALAPSQEGEENVNAVVDPSVMDNLHNHVVTLQEEQVKLAGQFANVLDDTKDEFNRKQQHIDALYDYIDKLQNNKADKEDITSSMDVKADKQALDSKVNMSTFDERYQMLEHALQDALNRLDQFVEKETSLTNAFNKLHSDLNSKMDSDAEKKLKKFLEDRLKEIQKSRNTLQAVEDENVVLEMRNAAGLRKPMPISYHCISCDRPVDITLRGVMGSVPQNFPAKKSIGPYTSYELDNLRNNNFKKLQHSPIERMNGGRQCGGQHTTVNSTMYRTQKNHQYSNDFVDAYDRSMGTEDLSVIDVVVGRDGQIYRGRYKPGQYIQPLSKKVIPPRGKHHLHKHRYVHSATTPTAAKENEIMSSKDEARSSSANFPGKTSDVDGTTDQKHPTPPLNGTHNGSPVANSISREKQRSASPLPNRNHSPVPPQGSREKQRAQNTSPISLPPISRDGSLVGEDFSNDNE